MTKEERYQYLDKLAAEAKTDASAKEEICRHFKKYIHRLSYGSYEDWSREDAEQDLWVCFLECLLSFDPSKDIHFIKYVMKMLKWSRLNMTRERELEKKIFSPSMSEIPDVPDANTSMEPVLNEKEVQTIIASCPLTDTQRKLFSRRMEGKEGRDIARENNLSFSVVYRHARNIRSIFKNYDKFQQTFVS